MSVLLTDHIFLQGVGRVSEGLRGRWGGLHQKYIMQSESLKGQTKNTSLHSVWIRIR